VNRPSADILDGKSQPVRLGALIGRGGEGEVYELAMDRNSAAKIYFNALSKQKIEKIRLMVAMRNPRLEKLAAWPQGVLTRRSGETIGFVMRRIVDRTDIHHLYSPKGRCTLFMRADWRFLLRAAANTARAFRVVHEAGCIIGDVNHGSILVGQDATVRLIDCDSFQIISENRKFLCEVGVETFTPPELQGKNFKEIIRTPNHDNFGLAVMVFLMLFMGRHPFAGRYLAQGDMTIARAIREYRFAYGFRRASVQMEAPPSTPPLSTVGDDVACLFERAFARDATLGGRPEASTWASALEALEKRTKQCGIHPSHWYLSNLRSCPWCRMEGETGVSLFPWIAQQTGTTFNLEILWAQIRAIPHPGPAPSFQSISPKPSEAAINLKGWNSQRKLLAACVAALPFAVLLLGAKIPVFWIFVASAAAFAIANHLGDRSRELNELRRKKDAATTDWARVKREWQTRAGSEAFDAKRSELEQLTQELYQLTNVRLRKLEELNARQQQLQMQEFLDRFEIDRATIPNIGPGRKQTLSSYGIETAADITERQLAKVPGFGPVLCTKLTDWRASIEARFRFDPARQIDPRHIAKVEQDILADRRRVEDELRSGPVELRTISSQILAARQHMRPQVEAVYARYLQATTDFEAAKN
jgi:DNA-binding helix-hairpin-helix protein with protein kinase domain